MSNELAKMKIMAYEDPKFENQIEDGEFVVKINPEGYKFSYKLDYGDNQAPGTSAIQSKFNKIKPEKLEFDFIFDKTGALPNTFKGTSQAEISKEREEGIIPDLEHFKEIVIGYKGDLHKPSYLIISWGTLLFKGVILEMGVEFKMFRVDGTPLRAVVKAKFEGFVEDELRVKKENDQSPDISHLRTVKDGDNLPLMSHRIYKDPAYYIKIAEVNKLINFRQLKTGQEIIFPPVIKTK